MSQPQRTVIAVVQQVPTRLRLVKETDPSEREPTYFLEMLMTRCGPSCKGPRCDDPDHFDSIMPATVDDTSADWTPTFGEECDFTILAGFIEQILRRFMKIATAEVNGQGTSIESFSAVVQTAQRYVNRAKRSAPNDLKADIRIAGLVLSGIEGRLRRQTPEVPS